MTRYVTRAERRAQTMQTIIVSNIRFYCDSKRRANIEPARATWRELRFSFPREEVKALDITEADLWKHLALMVRYGMVREYDSIRYSTYEVVEGSFNESL